MAKICLDWLGKGRLRPFPRGMGALVQGVAPAERALALGAAKSFRRDGLGAAKSGAPERRGGDFRTGGGAARMEIPKSGALIIPPFGTRGAPPDFGGFPGPPKPAPAQPGFEPGNPTVWRSQTGGFAGSKGLGGPGKPPKSGGAPRGPMGVLLRPPISGRIV